MRFPPQSKRFTHTESERMEKYSKQIDMKRKGCIAIPISDKTHFKTKAKETRDEEDHYIILKRVVQQEYITLIKIHAPNLGVPKYVRNILKDFKKEIDINTVITGDFNNPCQQWIYLLNKESTSILCH